MTVQVESKKVVFRQGKVWQLLPIGNRPTTVLKLVATADFQPFTITDDQQVFLAPHRPESAPITHRGSVLVKHGYITAVRSGNEAAGGSEPELIEILQTLRSSGADLSGSWVIDYDGTHAVKAADFIAKRGEWPAFESRTTIA